LHFYKPPYATALINFPLFHLARLSPTHLPQLRRSTTMTAYPNEIYSAFSFIGFLMCAIPFYWHLEGTWRIRIIGSCILRTHGIAWNTGTCMYMAWTGLGCLIQCINSIVWNGNTVNRAPFYCDIGELLDALCREQYTHSPLLHSNTYPDWAQRCNPSLLTLH
jgi:hypothetical protein